MRSPYDGGEQERDLATQYRTWADQLRDKSRGTGAVLDKLVACYEADALEHDASAERISRL